MMPPVKRRLCVAFTNMESGGRWTAGVHYLKNLSMALRALDADQQPEIALLTSGASPNVPSDLGNYIDRQLMMPLSPRWPGYWARQRARIEKRLGLWREPEPPLSSYLREQAVDVVFAGADFGPAFGIPLLAWIMDFQHRHLPEMFSAEQIESRDLQFARIAHYASRVILSSQSALADFSRFAPGAVGRARVLSFVAQVPATIHASDPGWVCDTYHLPEKFVYLPNQFWQHKNHKVVLQALSKLRRRQVAVVCTGNTNDYRAPLYFGELLANVSSLGLRDNFIILGMVPHEHIFQLMRQSLAVLQPSLFEGWSTTVEEARSVGKAIILSDIPVHREQNPPQADFFDPHDPEALSECLTKIFEVKEPGPDADLEALSREALPKRTLQFARTFMDIVREVVSVVAAD